MIHVHPQPEPPEFDAQVRQPGNAALAEGQHPLPAFWRKCLPQLWKAYGGVCAYLCIRIPRATGSSTVEHFAPKSKRPERAYEWLNYRLVCSLMNSRKGVFEDVLDPFEVQDGWFHLEPSTLEVLPNPALGPELHGRVQQTIERLRLNAPDCVNARQEHYEEYLKHGKDPDEGIPLGTFERWSPFVARELRRQGSIPQRQAASDR